MSYTLVSRQQAVEQGLTHYFDGKPCKHGHIERRYVGNSACVTCSFIRYKNQPADRKREVSRRWRANNPEKRAQAVAGWLERNPEKRKQAVKAYKRRNRDKVSADAARRRVSAIGACPTWLSPDHLKAIHDTYREAERLTVETSVPYHVDHIIPLRNKLVCGLHVPWNLQVIPASENCSKGNKLIETL